MCGRFVMLTLEEVEGVIKEIEFQAPINRMPDWPARRQDAFPRSFVPLIIEEESLVAKTMQWGFPSWNNKILFNTRIETALGSTTNMWRDALDHRRCIIPAFGFYESHKSETAISEKTGKQIKQQYLFSLPDTSILLMAGIYQEGYFSIITTTPNDSVSPIHDRMPLLLQGANIDAWMAGKLSSFEVDATLASSSV